MNRLLPLVTGFCLWTGITFAQESVNVLPDSTFNPSFGHLILHSGSHIPYSRVSNFSLEVGDTCTMFSSAVYLETDSQAVWIGGSNTYLLDIETGDRYAARKALHGFKLDHMNIAKDHKGKSVAYQIEFPRLSRYVKRVKVYGMPALGKYAERDYSLEELEPMKVVYHEYPPEPLMSYDDHMPQIKAPEVVKPKKAYQNNDSTTYPVFRNLQKVYPLTEDVLKKNSIALYATKDATYVTKIIECKQPRTLVRLDKLRTYICEDIPDSLEGIPRKEYIRHNCKLIESLAPYPVDQTFVIEGTPGDFVVIVIKFPPLRLGTNEIFVYLNTSGYCVEYEKDTVRFFGDVGPLAFFRNNQKYVRPMMDNRTVIIK